ncbi:MFS general substrate transporter [Yamadazyma tenuis]|uniref:MFS general substrate transporter n=1 Tax=Candida tenuis (strain ATCC 10573 / BCRC 21748 / CBS 615 / JCM 9827 / NBRC 10315 / NRRL Y-1498 / VKM Y-70) TaxID=590646 RepID=G3B071_CANTC|nr:MFS general substrate transporter [Yamadazyma tenuis ATCC 10573]EGV65333.1 MFS general substrate transporter [Yamadazyma tenuis ATCC 10573]WEJ95010.1 MFS general substrate transporter [Yamadazyma tenuis]
MIQPHTQTGSPPPPDPPDDNGTSINPSPRRPSHSLSSLESINSNASSSHPPPQTIDQKVQKTTNSIAGPADEKPPLNHAPSNTSAKSNRVPLGQRRGLLAQITLIPEYEDPRDYGPRQKMVIVLIVALAAICGPMGTSILLPAIEDVGKDLHTSTSVVNVSVGIYLLAMGIFPLWWSAFSEKHGRRNVYLVSFTMFVGFCVGCSLAPSIQTLIVFRVLCGGCSASVQSVGAGTIGDLYVPSERGRAMGWYYLGPLMGPFLSPILGGAVAQAWGWRATQWVLVIVSGLSLMGILFLLPETLRKQDDMANIRKLLASAMQEHSDSEKSSGGGDNEEMMLDLVQSVVRSVRSEHEQQDDQDEFLGEPAGDSIMPSLSRLTTNRSAYSVRINMETLQHELSKSMSRKSVHTTKWQSFKHEAYEYMIRPMHSLVLLGYPPVLLVICYSSISFSLVYFFNLTISYAYSKSPYNFSSVIVGLLYIPNSVTYVIASILGGRWNDRLLRQYAAAHNGEIRPEARISWNLVTAVLLFPPACLIFGWTLDKGLIWVVSLIGTAIFGFAAMLVIGATVTCLVDTLPGKGATGVALNNLIRQILAAVASFIVEPLLRALGPGVLYSILTGIIIVASGVLVYLKRNGDRFRERYDLSTFYDKL